MRVAIGDAAERRSARVGPQNDLNALLEDQRARIARLERLLREDAGNAQLLHGLGHAHQSCAEALESVVDVSHGNGGRQAMLEQYRASLAVRERRVRLDPNNGEWQRDLFILHKRIGDALRDQGNLAEALEGYRAALPIAERLAQLAPRHVRAQLDLYFAFAGIAMIEARLGERTRALSTFRRGRDVMARLKRVLPDDPNWPIYLDWIEGEIAKLQR